MILSSKVIITCHNYKNFKENLFLEDIAMSTIFSRIHYMSDVNKAWELWFQEFTRICNKHAPVRQHKVRSRSNPWITDNIRHLMYRRDHVRQLAIKHKCSVLHEEYRSLRNQVTYSIRKAKKLYFSNNIMASANNPRQTWTTLKKFLPNKTASTNVSPEMNAENFNSFFSTIGTDVTAHFGNTVLPNCNITPTNQHFSFSPINVSFVTKYLSVFKNSKKPRLY